MSTITRTRKPVKTTRFVKVLSRLDSEGKNGEIEITMTRGKKTEITRYWVDRVPADFGQGFLVEKQGDGSEENEEYHVNIDGESASCECPGHLRWNHCKHADSIRKLLELGKL